MYSRILNRNRKIAPGLLRRRFQLMLLVCFVWVALIVLRLLFLQILSHDRYTALAKKQRESIIPLYPERGPILDRRGERLAISIAMTSVYAIPDEIQDPSTTAKELADILNMDAEEIEKKARGKTFFWVARKINDEKAEEIRKRKFRGIYFTQESRRYYPNKDLAAHVLGFVGMDNKGLSGVEFQYNEVISGVPGKLMALRDAKRRLLLTGGEDSLTPPAVGRTLQLTIDAAIQHLVERELEKAVAEQNAGGGTVIIMNPYTGEILALANVPSFNPNAYTQYESQKWKNRAVQDYFEPGSTFKPVVAAAAIDKGLVDPQEVFDCQWGSIVLAGHIIKDHKPFGNLTFEQIIQKSSNVGSIKIGLRVGPETLVRYADLFGFGKKTGIDLPGETPGLIRKPQKWSAVSIGAISIGQEIGVTSLQILRMISAIGNGGYLVTPHIVARISDNSGNFHPTVFAEPQPLPLKHNTLLTLQHFLQGVVSEEGSGRLAQIPGYSVAGKTGTAQKIGPSGSYADGGYIASFVGYVPAERPVISMIALIDGPKKEHYGGRVAAPLFRRIGQQVLKYLDIPPDQITQNPAIQAELNFPRSTEALFPEGLQPVAFTTPPDTHHKLVTAPDEEMAGELVMPSLYGKTAGETVQILTSMHLPFRILGSGIVSHQIPAPGALLTTHDLIIITLSNHESSVTPQPDPSRK